MDQSRSRFNAQRSARDLMARKLEASVARKNNKPLMEKRRRARINSCLNQLKHLVLESTKKNAHAKLEKADILEITVGYLQKMRKRERDLQGPGAAALCHFMEGYSVCMADAMAFLDAGADAALSHRLLDHLQSRLQAWRLARTSAHPPPPPLHPCQPPLQVFIPKPASPVRPVAMVPCPLPPLTPAGLQQLALDTPENSPPQEMVRPRDTAPWRPW